MILNNYEVYKVLKEIMNKTYPEDNFSNFFVELQQTESKSKHGDYEFFSKKIRIFNLSRKKEYIIKTAIHELAHHCDVNIRKTSDHSKKFYIVYKQLLETAIEMGVVDWNGVLDEITSRDIDQLQKHCGPVKVYYNDSIDSKKDMFYIKVFNSFKIKNQLKISGYGFSKIESVWYKEISSNEQESEERKLKTYISRSNDSSIKYSITKVNETSIEPFYYITVVGDSYSKKNFLKDNQYYFQNKKWQKKIKAKDVKKEESFLNRLGLKLKIIKKK